MKQIIKKIGAYVTIAVLLITSCTDSKEPSKPISYSYPSNIAQPVHLDNDPNRPILGMDYIGGARYSDVVVNNHPEGFAAGFLWYVDGFGSAKEVIKRLADTGKAPIIRVHNIWRDNHKFEQAEYDLGIARCREVDAMVRLYPEIQWYVNPWLEPIGESKDLYFKTVNKCREIFNGTNVRMVSNSIPTHEFGATYTEMHHKDYTRSPQLKIFSYDGLEATKTNWQEYKAKITNGTELVYLWSWKMNGKSSKQDKRERADRIHWATASDIKRLVELVR